MSEIEKMLEERNEISEEIQDEMNRDIRKGISRNIYIRAVITVLVLALAVSGLWYGVRAVKEESSFHLDDLELLLSGRIEDSSEEVKNNILTLNAGWYLNCYVELFAPGNVFLLDPDAEPQEKAFGSWTVSGWLTDQFHMNPEYSVLPQTDGSSRMDFEIRNGKFIPDTDIDYILFRKNPFRNWWTYMSSWEKNHQVPDITEEITELPASAGVELDMKFKSPMDTDSLLLWLSQFADSTPVYAVTHLYMDKDNAYRIYPQGFSFTRSLYFGVVSEETREKYPGFSGTAVSIVPYYQTASFISGPRREHVKEELLSHYTSSLKLLLENDFLDGIEKDIAAYVYADLQKNEPEILGMRIYCSKADALKLLEDDNIQNIRIADIRLTRFD